MAAPADDDAYRSALRARLLGHSLTDEQRHALEAGRTRAGLREGCYPWPHDATSTESHLASNVRFEPPPAPRPGRRERYDPTIDEQIREAGRVPICPVRQWRD